MIDRGIPPDQTSLTPGPNLVVVPSNSSKISHRDLLTKNKRTSRVRARHGTISFVKIDQKLLRTILKVVIEIIVIAIIMIESTMIGTLMTEITMTETTMIEITMTGGIMIVITMTGITTEIITREIITTEITVIGIIMIEIIMTGIIKREILMIRITMIKATVIETLAVEATGNRTIKERLKDVIISGGTIREGKTVKILVIQGRITTNKMTVIRKLVIVQNQVPQVLKLTS